MTVDDVVGSIFETFDYDKFNFEKTNRRIGNIEKIKKDIERNGLMYEILVNQNFTIIDGQHRFEALKALGLPVQYKLKEDIGTNEMIGINTVSKNWKQKEYIEHYSKTGNKNYSKLIQLSKDYNVKLNALVRTRFTKGYVNDGTLIIVSYSEFKGFLDKFTDFRKKAFLREISGGMLSSFSDIISSEKYDHEYFMSKVEKLANKTQISQRTRTKEFFLEGLLEMNNFSLQEDSDKFIEFYYDNKKKIKIVK